MFSKLDELDNADRDTFQMLLLEGAAKKQIRCMCELLPLFDAVIEVIEKGN